MVTTEGREEAGIVEEFSGNFTVNCKHVFLKLSLLCVI